MTRDRENELAQLAHALFTVSISGAELAAILENLARTRMERDALKDILSTSTESVLLSVAKNGL